MTKVIKYMLVLTVLWVLAQARLTTLDATPVSQASNLTSATVSQAALSGCTVQTNNAQHRALTRRYWF